MAEKKEKTTPETKKKATKETPAKEEKKVKAEKPAKEEKAPKKEKASKTEDSKAEKKSDKKDSGKEKKKEQGKVGKWFHDLKVEFKKVVWPTKQTVVTNTSVVIAVIVASSVLVGLLDEGFLALLRFIYQ